MGVNVHETGRDDAVRRVDRLGGLAAKLVVAVGPPTDFDDLAVFDADVGPIAVRAGAVHNGAANNLHVIHAISSVRVQPTLPKSLLF